MSVPSLSPLSDVGFGRPNVAVPPPPHFRACSGRPRHIRFGAQRVQQQIHPSMPASKAKGIRYEWQVYSYLDSIISPVHIQHALHFEDDNGYRTVIPDAIVYCSSHVVLIEVKSQHMPETWWQCEKLYKPVLEECFQKPVYCLEIVRVFDPQMPFPASFEIVYDVKNWIESEERSSSWGVFKWRKKKT